MTQDPAMTRQVDEIREKTPLDAAEILAQLAPDEIQFILSRLDGDQAAAVASHLPESAAPDEAATRSILSGVEASMGELMTPAPAVLATTTTVAEALSFMVKSEEVTGISYIYVTRQHRLAGVVSMRDLLLAKPANTLEEIMAPEPFAFRINTPIEDAVDDVMERHYSVYPVVNESDQVVGVVHSWKLYERIARELSAQAGSQYGVDRDEQINTPVMAAFRMRHPWLLINLATAFIAAFVVGLFEDTITQVVALAVFLPVLAGQSGNTGCQAMAITLRGITLGKMRDYPVRKLLRKEMLLGALNGAIVGFIAGLVMLGYAISSESIKPLALGVVVLLAMIGACIGSGVFGVLVPLTLKRFGADPATASSIFLTTVTDIVGMGLMLSLATVLVL